MHAFVRLFQRFKFIVYLENVYLLKACPIPYPMMGGTMFVTFMNNVIASQAAYSLSREIVVVVKKVTVTYLKSKRFSLILGGYVFERLSSC